MSRYANYSGGRHRHPSIHDETPHRVETINMSGATNIEGGDLGMSPSHSVKKSSSSIETGDRTHQVGRNSAGFFSSSNSGSGEHAAVTHHAELEGWTNDEPSEVDRLPPNGPRGTRLSSKFSTGEEVTTSVPGRRLKPIELLAHAASQSLRLPEQPRRRLPPRLEDKPMARRCLRRNFQRYNSDNVIGSPMARETSSKYIAGSSSTHGQECGLGDGELGEGRRPMLQRPLQHLPYSPHSPPVSANKSRVSSNTTVSGYKFDDRSDAPSHPLEVLDPSRRVTVNTQETHADGKAAGHLSEESPPYRNANFTIDEGSAQRQCEGPRSFHPRRSSAFNGFQEEPSFFLSPEKYATVVSARGHRSPPASRSTGKLKSQYHRDGYKQQGRRSPSPLQNPMRIQPQGFRSRYAPEGSSYSMASAPWDALQREVVATQGPRLTSFCNPGRKFCSIRPKTSDIASGGGSIDQRCQLPCSSDGASQRPTYLFPYSNADGAHFSARFRQDAVVSALGHRSPSPLRTTGRVKPDGYRSRFAPEQLASPEIRRSYPSQPREEIIAGEARAALPLGSSKKDARSGPIYSTTRVASRAVGLKRGQLFEDHGLPRSGDGGMIIGYRLSKRKGTPSPPPPPLPPLPPLPSEPSNQNTVQERISRDLCGELEDERELFHKRRKTGGHDSFTEDPQGAATDRAVRKPLRKKKNSLVWSQFRKACDRCTEKKVRCNGSNPTGGFNACTPCKRAGESCVFGICRRSGPRDACGHKTTEAGVILKRGEFEKVTERYGACRIEGCYFANKDGSFRREHYHCRIGNCSYTGKNMSYLLIHRQDDHEELPDIEASSSTMDASLTPEMTEEQYSNKPRGKRMACPPRCAATELPGGGKGRGLAKITTFEHP